MRTSVKTGSDFTALLGVLGSNVDISRPSMGNYFTIKSSPAIVQSRYRDPDAHPKNSGLLRTSIITRKSSQAHRSSLPQLQAQPDTGFLSKVKGAFRTSIFWHAIVHTGLGAIYLYCLPNAAFAY